MLKRALVYGFFAALACSVAIIGYVVFIVADAMPAGAFKNVSASMEPALLVGDRFTVRLVYGTPHLARGDIITHVYPPDHSKEFVKRVVGLSGDTLGMVNGALRVNGRAVAEPYAWREDSLVDPVTEDFKWQHAYWIRSSRMTDTSYRPSRNNWGPIVLPAHVLFVLGDNRDNSLDSRYFGFLADSEVRGHARRIYLSYDSSGHIRWNRLGHRPL